MTLSATVTASVSSISIWRITAMPCCTESPFVGLHDVKLRAPVTTNLICIAVFERVTIVIDCRHENIVKSSNTATASFAQINIVLNTTSNKVCSEIALRIYSIDCR